MFCAGDVVWQPTYDFATCHSLLFTFGNDASCHVDCDVDDGANCQDVPYHDWSLACFGMPVS